MIEVTEQLIAAPDINYDELLAQSFGTIASLRRALLDEHSLSDSEENYTWQGSSLSVVKGCEVVIDDGIIIVSEGLQGQDETKLPSVWIIDKDQDDIIIEKVAYSAKTQSWEESELPVDANQAVSEVNRILDVLHGMNYAETGPDWKLP